MLANHRPKWGSKMEKAAVTLVLLVFVILAVTYSVVTPIFEGYDEPWHYAYVEHIATGKGLPRQPPDLYDHLAHQEASQPPLYYLLASAVTCWIPNKDLAAFLHLNPQFATIPWGYRDNQNIIVHSDAERFPYKGTVLAVHLSRCLSVLLGAGTVYCTYALARRLFPEPRILAFGSMLVAAFTPSFLFASALVNNDILATFLASLTLVLLARIWQCQFSPSLGVWLGIALGCAALTKLSGLLLWPLAGLVLVVLAIKRRDGRVVTRLALPAFGLAMLVSGWWYARNWVLYQDFSGLNMMLDIVGRREPGFGLRDVWSELQGMRWSYWALFGWFNVPVTSWLYWAFDLVSLIGVAGLGLSTVDAIRKRRVNRLQALGFLFVWLVLSFIGLMRWTLTTVGSQGRLLYPAISAISVLLVVGWLMLLPQRRAVRTGVIAAIGCILLAIALYVPLFVIKPAYARPSPLSPDEVADQVSHELNVTFQDEVTLLGYQLDRQMVMPGDLLWVKACWKGNRRIAADYFVFVQVLMENDLIAAQKDTYHGLGSFPTSLWPLDVIFCERYPLRVADTVPTPGLTVISIGLYRSTGERLTVQDASGQLLGDNVRFPGPGITFPEAARKLEYEWGHRIALVDYRLDTTTVAPGDELNMTLNWQAIRRMSSNYAATVQIVDAQGKKIGQSDVLLPTSTWQSSGSPLADRRSIEIAPEAAPGVYQINVAVYEPETVSNLALFRRQQILPGGGLLTLWTVRVTPK